MSYVLALDQGTTSSRAIVYDDSLNVLGVSQHPFQQHFPQPGRVEHDPNDIWETQLRAAREALAAASLSAPDITAIGITNQRETTIVWDRTTGHPLMNAIVWQDRRTAESCAAQRADGREPLVQAATGLLLDPYFSASKIAWILEHCPGARAAAGAGRLAFGTVDSWLIWRLTDGGTHLTDHTNASRTALYNIDTHTWDAAMLDMWGVPADMLPQLAPSSGEIATCSYAEFAGIPITGVAGDQQAALFGQNCFAAGDAKCTYGTGCFVLQHAGTARCTSDHRLLSTVAWQVDGTIEYALEGSVFIGGAVVQWLRDGLGIIDQAAEVEALAASVPDSGGVVFVPAFAGLGTPYWDPHARGTLLGITRGTTRGHIARAALEGIAYQVADVLQAMQSDTGTNVSCLKVDGGASANDLLMQLQADILQTTLARAPNVEITAVGAAALAGLGAGVWRDRATLAAIAANGTRFEPVRPAADQAHGLARWREAIRRAREWDDAVSGA